MRANEEEAGEAGSREAADPGRRRFLITSAKTVAWAAPAIVLVAACDPASGSGPNGTVCARLFERCSDTVVCCDPNHHCYTDLAGLPVDVEGLPPGFNDPFCGPSESMDPTDAQNEIVAYCNAHPDNVLCQVVSP